MTLKRFTNYRILVAVLLGTTVSISFAQQNYLFALVAMASAMIILYLMKQRVQDVIADERDYALAGQASRYTVSIFSLVLVAAMFITLALKTDNQTVNTIAYLLSYLVCFLMLLNSFIFRFLSLKAKVGQVKISEKIKFYLPYFLVALIFSALLAIGGLRFFSGEDDWICSNGAWIKHGQPDATQPSKPCL